MEHIIDNLPTIGLIAFFALILAFQTVYRKTKWGNKNAKNIACRFGFHKPEIQQFDGNDYIHRITCQHCDFKF